MPGFVDNVVSTQCRQHVTGIIGGQNQSGRSGRNAVLRHFERKIRRQQGIGAAGEGGSQKKSAQRRNQSFKMFQAKD